MGKMARLGPDNCEVAILSFEGPDPYARAGGLATRVTELSRALAEQGFRTHLYFIGDPYAPAVERQFGGRLTLHRWSQWVSKYYPQGVYHGEEEKLYDFNESLPWHVMEEFVRPAVAAGRVPVILAEEWHTAHVTAQISDLLHWHGLRDKTLILWNANNTMGFERINWGRLSYVSTITTVSRYMKHIMWRWGVNPIVIPNGIPSRLLKPVPLREVQLIRQAIDAPLALFKIGRFDPDKRWLMAIEAVARLKAMGEQPRLLIRGGIEPHGAEVLARARQLGLTIADVPAPEPGIENLARALAAHRGADVLNLRFLLPVEYLRVLYRAVDAVLANSGSEPFGLVGLEVMAAGGIVFTGATGEEYARPFANAVVLETDDPREICSYLLRLVRDEARVERMRQEARATAEAFTWERVIELLLYRLEFAADQAGLAIPQPAAALAAAATGDE